MFDGCTIRELNDKKAEIVNAEGAVLAVINDLLISVKKSLDEAQDNLGKIDVNKLDDVNTMRVACAKADLNDIFKEFIGLLPLAASLVKDNEEFI